MPTQLKKGVPISSSSSRPNDANRRKWKLGVLLADTPTKTQYSTAVKKVARKTNLTYMLVSWAVGGILELAAAQLKTTNLSGLEIISF